MTRTAGTTLIRSGFALVLGSLLLAGCGPDQATIDAIKGLNGDATNGAKLYEANCQVCHGADGVSGTARKRVPSEMAGNADEAIGVILTGEDEMPAFEGTLTQQQIADIRAYVLTL